jgi:hypothetical protein
MTLITAAARSSCLLYKSYGIFSPAANDSQLASFGRLPACLAFAWEGCRGPRSQLFPLSAEITRNNRRIEFEAQTGPDRHIPVFRRRADAVPG